MFWRNCHLVVGALGLILFVLQGQYMARVLGVGDLPDAPRMLYRSAHIYLLLASVSNVCAGYYMTLPMALNHLQRLIAGILLLSPAMLIWSFFAESNGATLDRPVATTALYLLFGAAVLLLMDAVLRRGRR